MIAAAAPSTFWDGVRQAGDWLNRGFTLGGVDITVGSVLGALLLLAIFIFGSLLLKRLLRRYARRNTHINQSTIYTFQRLLHYALLTIGVLWALSTIGVPMSKLTVFAGALGVGLGFGLQAIFNNFVSGLILLFERTLKVGDFVELASGVHGHVRDIYIRATRITTNDDIDILVPNSEFVNGRVVNWTLREVARRLKVPFRVAHGTDKELVKKAALEAAAQVPFSLGLDGGARSPQVWLTKFGESALEFNLVVWLNADAVRRPGTVIAAYNWALHTALEKHGIVIPFPQRDLHVREWARPRHEHSADESRPPAPAQAAAAPPRPATNDAARDIARDIAEEAAAKEKAAAIQAQQADIEDRRA